MDTTNENQRLRPESLGAVLRAHRLIFMGVALFLLVAVVAIGEISRGDRAQYHAEALVVANELAVRVESLPKTAVAVFETAATAERIADLSGTEIDPEDLIPAIVRAEPVETTPVVEVDATYHDPDLAVIYANVGAMALAEELNRIGPGLGSFSVQQWARAPSGPIPKQRRQLAISALISSIALTLGAAALVAAVNRRR